MLQIDWRTGVNMREFAYYGSSFHPQSTLQLQRTQLEALHPLHIKLVRFYASRVELSPDATIPFVRKALDQIGDHGMQAIVCLEDSIGSGFNVPETGQFRIQTGDTSHLDKRYWREKLYRRHFLPHIIPIVEALQDHDAVAIWELGNEYALHPRHPLAPEPDDDDALAFFEFVQEASETIKQLAPTHLVSIGLVTVRHVVNLSGDVQAQAERLHGLPTIDVVSVHFYEHDDEELSASVDVEAAKVVEKPFYVGEVGASVHRPVHRPTYLRERMTTWRDRGAFAVMPWAFDASTTDVNIADDKGIAGRFGDFQEMVEVVRSLGAEAAYPITKKGTPASHPQPRGDRRRDEEGHILPPCRFFRVVGHDHLMVRDGVGLEATVIGRLAPNDEIEVLGKAHEADGFRWWQHNWRTAEGQWVKAWSAECRLDALPGTADVYMEKIDALTQETDPRAKPVFRDFTPFIVVRPPEGIYVRKSPSQQSAIIGDLVVGEIINAYACVVNPVDGLIWRQHDEGRHMENRDLACGTGWSAEGPANKSFEPFMVQHGDSFRRLVTPKPAGVRLDPIRPFKQHADDPINASILDVNQLPLRDAMFEKLPVEVGMIIQQYGNTDQAFEEGTLRGYDEYSQGLHGGIDLYDPDAIDGLVPVWAGVTGKIVKPHAFGPRSVWVEVETEIPKLTYHVIYGHLHPETPLLEVGTRIDPGTKLGHIATKQDLEGFPGKFGDFPLRNMTPHVHLEIRYKAQTYILNPLLFFGNTHRDQLAEFQTQNYQEWHKWQTPFDQPVILRGSKATVGLIGPRMGT